MHKYKITKISASSKDDFSELFKDAFSECSRIVCVRGMYVVSCTGGGVRLSWRGAFTLWVYKI
jgi:hypothetical protein